jgi:prepilin-type N-terminal cleavage/methylation domain-containing protein
MKRGFTVLESLVVIAILAVLMGLIFAAMGPARDKGRQAVCVNNLKQISQAIQMYRQDHSGSDSPGHYFEMGLPAGPEVLAKTGYLGAWTNRTMPPGVWICPHYRLLPPPTIDFGSYSYHVCDDKYGGIGKPLGRCRPSSPGRGGREHYVDFLERIRIRGDDYPLVADANHNIHNRPRRRDEPEPPMFLIILRLNGQVRTLHLSPDVTDSWQY